MSVLWLERPSDPTTSLAPTGIYDGTPASPDGALFGTVSDGDSISRFTQPQSQTDPYDASQSSGGGLYSIVAQLMSVIGQLLGQMGYGNSSSSSWFGGNEQYYANASGGSNGDPHLSFNGSTWNDMNGESNLLNSNSIPGGFQISTQATTPNANGVTYNQQATVTTHGGRTQVTLDNNGTATLTRDGVTTNIAPGQTIDLHDETISRNQDGALQIACTNGSGGQIATTLSQTSNGEGVNVNVSASNVDLGGALAAGNTYPPRSNGA